MLKDILAKLPSEAHLNLQYDDKNATATLTTGRIEFKLLTLPAEDFPDFKSAVMTHQFMLTNTELKSLFQTVGYAAEKNGSRWYLQGIYLHVVGEQLRSVATDGHVLSSASISLPTGAKGMAGIIVPTDAAEEAVRLAEGQDTIAIELGPSGVTFTTGNTTLRSKIIDATYPDYAGAVPKDNAKIIKLDVDLFRAALERVATVASRGNPGVKFTFNAGKLELTAKNHDSGDSAEEIEVDYDGEPLVVGFSNLLVKSTLDQLGDNAILKLHDQGTAAVLEPGNRDRANFAVVMPMRV
jgi:DNA polymerase-3 subunit beta